MNSLLIKHEVKNARLFKAVTRHSPGTLTFLLHWRLVLKYFRY